MREMGMAGILSNLRNTVITGFVVTLVLFIIIRLLLGTGFALDNSWFQFLFRWLHVLSGVMWIGLLWYFNFVQIPNMPNIPDDQKPAIGKVIAPAALWWFRWGAMATIVTGIILAGLNGYLLEAIVIGLADSGCRHPEGAMPRQAAAENSGFEDLRARSSSGGSSTVRDALLAERV